MVSDNGASPQFTLTCISTGGPATTVSWTRDNELVTGEQNATVLNDAKTARYTHTLTVTTAGVYTCTVANNKPSTATSNSFTLQGNLAGLPCHLNGQIFLHIRTLFINSTVSARSCLSPNKSVCIIHWFIFRSPTSH